MMLLIIAVILVILLASMTTYEHMTNKDMLTALKEFGVDDDVSEKKPQGKAPIYGPKTSGIAEPDPSAYEDELGDSAGMYPDIFGPDTAAAPGTKNLSYSEDEYNDYNVDLKAAFPTDGPPQPFLTDFSEFQS